MSAVISPCRKYRYTLTRNAGLLHPEKGSALFIMLNPSTADETMDDATIRRCMGFARTWSCNGLVVGNLYALRATDPSELWKAQDPVGLENDRYLRQMMSEMKDVVCAWGNNARPERVEAFTELAREAGAILWCLGTTKTGQPRHPLYVKANQQLLSWWMPERRK